MRVSLRVSRYVTRAGEAKLKGQVFDVPDSEGQLMVDRGKAQIAPVVKPRGRAAYLTRRLLAED